MSNSDPLLRVDGLSSRWGRQQVLREVGLSVARSEYFVLLGPNGSGKTTLLRILAGLESPSAGRIELEGEDLTGRPAHRRGIGLMFQDPALFPHRSVYENIAYAPLLQRRPRAELDEEVSGLISLLRLEGFEDRSPDALSGGERQRVALARTLAARPKLVLLDEPFASIDVDLRGALRAEFREVLRSRQTAAIHVTHDREEALFLADRIGLLFAGSLEVVGPPAAVYTHPPTARAARFLGYNVVPSRAGTVGVDPHDVTLAREPPGVPVEIANSGPVGRERLAIVRSGAGERWEVRGGAELDLWRPGQRAYLRFERSEPLPAEREAPGRPSEGSGNA